jgi:hypothetical protein
MGPPEFHDDDDKRYMVSAIVMMDTLKAYFNFVFCGSTCGIQRVTLEGEK